jgi:hypothetical protein
MMLLKPKVGGSTGKGPGEIVACGASWHVVFDDGLMQLAARRATRPESFVLTPPRGEPLRRPPSRPTPAHPTQAWAMEGAGSAETADPTGAARVATLHGPHPPRPPVRRFRSPLETGSRPPGPPPSTAHPRRFPHRPTAPATRSIYSLVWEEKTRRPRLRQTQAVYCPPNRGRPTGTNPGPATAPPDTQPPDSSLRESTYRGPPTPHTACSQRPPGLTWLPRRSPSALTPLCQDQGGAGGLLLSCPTSRQKRPAHCRGRIYPTTLEIGKDLRDGHETKRASTARAADGTGFGFIRSGKTPPCEDSPRVRAGLGENAASAGPPWRSALTLRCKISPLKK